MEPIRIVKHHNDVLISSLTLCVLKSTVQNVHVYTLNTSSNMVRIANSCSLSLAFSLSLSRSLSLSPSLKNKNYIITKLGLNTNLLHVFTIRAKQKQITSDNRIKSRHSPSLIRSGCYTKDR